MAQPQLPPRFPCWCRATYSWGGETKRDLGFIEGDLIECLNAGDGSWWMGRLHRDKRAMGLFPSNFVKILDESFHPVSRSVSPLPSPVNGQVSSSLRNLDASTSKSKTFRRPFQAYVETSGSPTSQSISPSLSALKSKGSFRKPFQTHAQAYLPNATPPPSTKRTQHPQLSPSLSKESSLVQDQQHSHGTAQDSFLRSSSPLVYLGRSASLQESWERDPTSSVTLLQPYTLDLDEHALNTEVDENTDSSPPPVPPPHRVKDNTPVRWKNHSPTDPSLPRPQYSPQGITPISTSPAVLSSTPSPLRDAMEDVMSSLQHMTIQNDKQSPPVNNRILSNHLLSEASENLQTGCHIAIQPDDPRLDRSSRCEQSPCSSRGKLTPHMVRAATTCARDELSLPDKELSVACGFSFHPKPDGDDRPSSAHSMGVVALPRLESLPKLKNRKSAYELSQGVLDRTFTTKSSATSSSSGVRSTTSNGSSSTQRTSQSIMSGQSAGAFSATSAGSLVRKRGLGSNQRDRPQSIFSAEGVAAGGTFTWDKTRSTAPSQLVSNHSRSRSAADPRYMDSESGSAGVLGGLNTPKATKSGFFKKLVESAKTGAASARGSLASGQNQPPRSPIKNLLPHGVAAISGGKGTTKKPDLLNEQHGMDWVQVRRDVNRSNSLSQNERAERAERCEMVNYPVIAGVDSLLQDTDGDEGYNGLPVNHPTDFRSVNLQLIDKSTRFVSNTPPAINVAGLVQGYLCRPYKSDIQKLRAIFIWISERIAWEEDFEGDVDTRRVLQTRRGCSEEIAVLVLEMCQAVGIHADVVHGYLKAPGEALDFDSNKAPNHWWNAVVAEGEWRIMDCSLANPTNPRRGWYSQAPSQIAEAGYFLTRPSEICYTHVPYRLEQQHICPSLAPEVLFALPCACPSFFKNQLRMVEYDTSLSKIDNLELVQVQFTVPPDIECIAETEVREYCRDVDGDFFESGNVLKARGLAQAEWVKGEKRYTVKGHLPGDEGHGILRVYTGKRGLMHSIKDNPHPLSFSIPIIHTGPNPPYQFFLRHPTPHAQRHDLYVVQPQCFRLAINSTFVFAIRQHPSNLPCFSPSEAQTQAALLPKRPSSAMSMMSSSAVLTANDYFSQAGSSGSSASSYQSSHKPAKLAIQSPTGKIIRLIRKSDNSISTSEAASGGLWETIIKVGERGSWRGLVLADRSTRWCVFGEWECF